MKYQKNASTGVCGAVLLCVDGGGAVGVQQGVSEGGRSGLAAADGNPGEC